MLSLLTQFGDNSSGLGALGLNIDSFVIQLITFVIALLVLKKWAFKPIMKIMNDRRQTIAKGVELGETMQKEKDELDARVGKEIAAARARADAIVTDASEAGKEVMRKAEQDALAKAELIVSEAREQTVQDMDRAKRKLEAEIIDLIAEATEVITGEKVDQKKDSELIDRALASGVNR